MSKISPRITRAMDKQRTTTAAEIHNNPAIHAGLDEVEEVEERMEIEDSPNATQAQDADTIEISLGGTDQAVHYANIPLSVDERKAADNAVALQKACDYYGVSPNRFHTLTELFTFVERNQHLIMFKNKITPVLYVLREGLTHDFVSEGVPLTLSPANKETEHDHSYVTRSSASSTVGWTNMPSRRRTHSSSHEGRDTSVTNKSRHIRDESLHKGTSRTLINPKQHEGEGISTNQRRESFPKRKERSTSRPASCLSGTPNLTPSPKRGDSESKNSSPRYSQPRSHSSFRSTTRSPPRQRSNSSRQRPSPPRYRQSHKSGHNHSSYAEDMNAKMWAQNLDCMAGIAAALKQENKGSNGPGPSNYLKGAKIPTFDGMQDQCIRFLNAIKSAAQASGLTLDEIIHKGLTSYLLDAAYEWFTENQETFTNWETFVTQFKNRFGLSETGPEESLCDYINRYKTVWSQQTALGSKADAIEVFLNANAYGRNTLISSGLRSKESFHTIYKSILTNRSLYDDSDPPAQGSQTESKTAVVDVHASHQGLGAVLCQDEDVWNEKKQEFIPTPKPVAFASRVLRGAEVRYSTPELECLAVVWAIEWFKPYIEYTTFILESDAQAFKWLMSTPEPSERFGRWAIRIQSGAFKIIYRQGRLNCVADVLSRAPLPTEDIPADDYLEMKEPTLRFYHPDDPVDSPSKEEIKSTELSEEGEGDTDEGQKVTLYSTLTDLLNEVPPTRVDIIAEQRKDPFCILITEYLMLDDEQKKKKNEKFSKEFKEKAKGLTDVH
uniref:Reverse transcriptase RNase H-like domain-containing protein n=1 Tax=Strigamia maritima TaxID=126957 RepID=T1ILE2_STRMM